MASDHLAVPQGKGTSRVLRESLVDFQKQKMLYSILYFLRKHYFLVLKVNEDFFPRGKLRRSAILLLSDVPLTHAVKAEAGLLLGLRSSAKGSQPSSPAQLPAAEQGYISINRFVSSNKGFPSGAGGKEPACQCRRCKRLGLDSWVGKIPWRRAWQPTPVFLPGESHGQRSLEGCRYMEGMARKKSYIFVCIWLDLPGSFTATF